MIELTLAVAFAVVISAMCSLFEAVLYSVPLSYVESLAQSGRPSGLILQRLRRNVDRPIAAILSLNTIANTAGAAIAGAAAARIFGHGALVYFSVVFTLVILVFSEVLPKTAGLLYRRALAPVIARPLDILVRVMAPMVWLSRFSTRLMSRGRLDHAVTEDEFMMLIRMGLQTGTLEADEAQAITNILQMESKTVAGIMTPRTVVFALSAQLTILDVRHQASGWVHSRIPVYEKGSEDIIGIVHRGDVLAAIAEDRWEVKIGELMKPVHFVLEILTLDRLLRMFLERRQHLFVVVDEFGGLAGVVALEDVLEEILGKEIVDESDQVIDMRELAHRRREQTLRSKKGGRPGAGS